MRYLLSGCAGFIGAEVTRILLQQGHEVLGIDNLDEAYEVTLKKWRLKALSDYSGFTFIKADIRDLERLDEIFARFAPFSAIINLAAKAGVRNSILDPQSYYETNLMGTLNLLELAKRYGVKKFVLASTSSVYGQGAQVPFNEEMPTSKPLSPYAASKKAAETLCYTYHHLYGIDITVFRYFTVYGPAGRPDMAYFKFIKWILEGEPLLLYGDGSQKRDFTYVKDIAEGTVLGLKTMGYQVINLGNDNPQTLLDLVYLLEELTGKKARIKFLPSHPADMRETWADIKKAKTLLGWTPKTTFKEGLWKTVKWYLENRSWVKEIKLP
jgi:dTDP-glucose 4,6-dehydratase